MLLLFTPCVILAVASHCSSYGEDGDSPAPPPNAEAGGDGSELAGCDASKEPRTELCLVAEGSSSVFVSPNGNDGAPGTRAAPVHTLDRAVKLATESKKARVIACEGTYPEPILIANSVGALPTLGIHGGFSCADWTPTAGRTRIIPTAGMIAMRISPSPTHVKLQDVDLIAGDGDALFKQSIGIVLTNANLEVKRVRISAGNGFDATPGSAAAPPTNTLPAAALAGAVPSGSTPPAAKTCTCPRFGTSTGGKGGAGPNENGGMGGAMPPPLGINVNGGTAASGDCNGRVGLNGIAGDAGVGATMIGTMDPLGFIEAAGSVGGTASAGQGGGGGAGNSNGPGTGGGCGSCGGAGGGFGEAGGSSIGILAWSSKLTLSEVEITTGKGGAGAKGGDGEGSVAGGIGAFSLVTCRGGNGGVGGGGGGGGGGAGGSSFGVLYYNDVPTIDGAPLPSAGSLPFVRLGSVGIGGLGGGGGNALSVAPVTGAPGTKGVDGQSSAVFVIPKELVGSRGR